MAELNTVTLEKGESAQAKWKYGNKWFNVIIDSVNEDGTFALSYEDGDKWEAVPRSRIRTSEGIVLDPNPSTEQNNKHEKRATVKSGKWHILRKAILSKSNAQENDANQASIHRHDGFHMFEKVPETDVTRSPECQDQIITDQGYHIVCYKVPVKDTTISESSVQLRILEREMGAKLSLSEIAPTKLAHGEGVDNTGNVRVWPAEEILLHVVLNGLKRSLGESRDENGSNSFPILFPPSFVGKGDKKVLELGGGMTCLAGLGLAVAGLHAHSTSESHAAETLLGQITLTDGNPTSVSKQKENIELNQHLLTGVAVSAHVLFWELNDDSGTEARMMEEIKERNASPKKEESRKESSACENDEAVVKYDLIMGADLLFGALACCLDRLLTSDGMVLLCQPSRGGTMEKFTQHPMVLSKFEVRTYDTLSFDPVVAKLHNQYLSDPTYEPSIHSPALLRLTRRA